MVDSLRQQAEDISDPPNQKIALTFLNKGVSIWGQQEGQNGTEGGLPGFDRFIYERLVPAIFRVPSSLGFNAKDGQMLMVCVFTG